MTDTAAQDSSTLRSAVATATGGRGIALIRPVIGTTQPTLAAVRIVHGEAVFSETLAATEPGGDSTVARNAAWPAGSAPTYLPQKHGQLASTHEAISHVVSVLTEQAIGSFQGEGLGLRLPDAAQVATPFDVVVAPTSGGRATLRLLDADSGRQLDRKTPISREGRLTAQFTVCEPGLYRISASGGAFSPVEELLVVLP